jgi:hypothetical protein
MAASPTPAGASARGRPKSSPAAARAAPRGGHPAALQPCLNQPAPAPSPAPLQVGVAIAATPSDMVAAAADLIVLNGRGVTNLPWLFCVADRTQSVLRQVRSPRAAGRSRIRPGKRCLRRVLTPPAPHPPCPPARLAPPPRQNLALALVSVVIATLPTLAGLFPLWLAVTLHEGSTLLVALNSLRLLVDAPGGSSGAGAPHRAASPATAPAAVSAAEGSAPVAAAPTPALKVVAPLLDRNGSMDASEPEVVRSPSSSSSSSEESSSAGDELARGGGASSTGSAGSVASECEEGPVDTPLSGNGGSGLARAPSSSNVSAPAGKPRRRRRAPAAARLFGGVRGAGGGCHEHRHADCGACTPFTVAPCGKKGANCSHCHRTL